MTRFDLRTMIKLFAAVAVALAALLPLGANGEPIRLKLSYFGPEQRDAYKYGMRPFVDAVNAEGTGVVAIDVYADGRLGKSVAEQPRLVLDGIADIAWIVPGQTPYRFPDNELMEQPGIFRNMREGTLAYTRLVATGALRYQDFFVIGAYTSAPSVIASSKPIGSLAALKGQKIRGNNPTEVEFLERLGTTPTVMEVSKLMEAIRQGAIDGASFSPAAIFDFGISRVATNYYLLNATVAPLLFAMNRKKFDSLPETAQALIQKYSGEWTAAHWIRRSELDEKQAYERIKSDTDHAVEPSPSDLRVIERVSRAMHDAWIAKSPRNRELWALLEKELETIRSTKSAP